MSRGAHGTTTNGIIITTRDAKSVHRLGPLSVSRSSRLFLEAAHLPWANLGVPLRDNSRLAVSVNNRSADSPLGE
jgi:hypothetical protein